MQCPRMGREVLSLDKVSPSQVGLAAEEESSVELDEEEVLRARAPVRSEVEPGGLLPGRGEVLQRATEPETE